MTELSLAEFTDRSVMPAADITDLETQMPGWVDRQIAAQVAEMYGRLRKRYTVPFSDPVPEVVKSWITKIVTRAAYLRRGVDPRDQQFASIDNMAKEAIAAIKEAADSKDGLYDLPLRQDTASSGISQGEPMFYSEASPWDWTDVQAAKVYG